MEEHALPPEPAFAGASFQFGPRLRRAVDLVKQNPLPAWLGGFLFLLVSQNRTDFNLPSSESGSDAVDTMMLFAFIAMGLFGLAMFFAYPVIAVGFLRFQESLLRTGRAEVAQLFNPEGRYLTVLGIRVLRGLAMFAPMIPAALILVAGVLMMLSKVGGDSVALYIVLILAGVVVGLAGLFGMVYIYLGFVLAERVAVFEDMRAMDALRQSWRYANGMRGSLFGFFFLSGLVMLASVVLGFLALCVGVLVFPPLAMAATEIAFTDAYLLATNHRNPEVANAFV